MQVSRASVVRFGSLYGGGDGTPDPKEVQALAKRNEKAKKEGKPLEALGFPDPAREVSELGLRARERARAESGAPLGALRVGDDAQALVSLRPRR